MEKDSQRITVHGRTCRMALSSHNAVKKLTLVPSIIGTACKNGRIAPSLIDAEVVWGLMLESVTLVIELSIKIDSNDKLRVGLRDTRLTDLVPCEFPFQPFPYNADAMGC